MCTHEVKGGTWEDWTCILCGYSPKNADSPSINRGPQKIFIMGSSNLQVRVNGVIIAKLTLRRQMRSGYPDGPWEVVVTDPVLGQFAIDDSFDIELKEVRKPWRKIFSAELLTTLESIGTTH